MKKLPNILKTSVNRGIARIKINDPASYNALSFQMLRRLIECFKKFSNDKKI